MTNKSNNQVTPKQNKSLTTFANFTMVGIVMVFVLLTWLSYSKLSTFRDLLFYLADEAMPRIINAATINNEINNLAFAAVALASADNNASRRIAGRKIDLTVRKLHKLNTRGENNNSLARKLAIFEQELTELDKLVKRKLENTEQVNLRQKQLFNLIDHIEKASEQRSQTSLLNTSSLKWIWEFNRIAALSGRLVNAEKLQQIRQISIDIDYSLRQFNAAPTDLTPRFQSITDKYQGSLAKLLSGPTGLIALKTSQLKVISRTRGRGNFVSNLIIDYSKLIEFQSYQFSDTNLKNAHRSTQQMDSQLKLFAGLFILGITLVISLTAFIQLRVVSRLGLLNNYIHQRLTGKSQRIEMPGKDEINQLAATFDDFANTIEKQKKELIHISLSIEVPI